MKPSSIAVAILLLASPAFAQSHPYPSTFVHDIYVRLLSKIEKIPTFDHHAHPGFPDDTDVDAMASPPGSAPLRERDTNPELVAAAKALFQYPYDDLSPEHAKWLVNKKAEIKKQQGTAYFSNLLDKLNIEQGVANRAMMADYLDPKRFVWVFSPTRSCGRSTIRKSEHAMPTRLSTCRCRKKCCTAGWIRSASSNFPQASMII